MPENIFKFTPLVTSLPSSVPFVGPETQERKLESIFKARIGANENVFGPSPNAIIAMQEANNEIWKYGDPENYDLKKALAKHHNIPGNSVVIGEGIDGLLSYIVRMFINPGDRVVTSDGAYPTFNFHVSGYGGELHKVPYKDDREDPQALIQKASEVGAKLIYLANPDNPMGTWHSRTVVQKMIDSVPNNCLLILDEAYIDFADPLISPLINPTCSSVIRMRTFSKGYGLAGARIGYAIGHSELIKGFDKIRNHFGVGRLSQVGALAALLDQKYLKNVFNLVTESRNKISEIAVKNGLKPIPSAANFVTIDCNSTADFSQRLLSELIKRGIFVRMPFVKPKDRAIRISCGLEKDLHLLEELLPLAILSARAY
jgi:histidinol-phosphate aminotransferase